MDAEEVVLFRLVVVEGSLEGVEEGLPVLLELALEVVEAHVDELEAPERGETAPDDDLLRDSGIFRRFKEPVRRFALRPVRRGLFGPAGRHSRGIAPFQLLRGIP